MEPKKIIELVRRPPTEELLTEEKLKEYLHNGTRLQHYIGYEIPGFVHLARGTGENIWRDASWRDNEIW